MVWGALELGSGGETFPIRIEGVEDHGRTEMPSQWHYRSRYRTIDCPVHGCVWGRRGTPLHGTVPGIRRHVRAVHGDLLYGGVEWPSIYIWEPSPGGMTMLLSSERGRDVLVAMSFRELRVKARERGVVQYGKSKAELIEGILATYGSPSRYSDIRTGTSGPKKAEHVRTASALQQDQERSNHA